MPHSEHSLPQDLSRFQGRTLDMFLSLLKIKTISGNPKILQKRNVNLTVVRVSCPARSHRCFSPKEAHKDLD